MKKKSKPKAKKKTPARRTRKKAQPAPGPKVLAVHRPLSEEEVRIRAYHRYLARGGEHGHDLEDWYLAENELSS